jgi:hypothetical protein
VRPKKKKEDRKEGHSKWNISCVQSQIIIETKEKERKFKSDPYV